MKSEGQKASQAHEKRLAGKVGGTVRPASGAFATAKGDVRQDRDENGNSFGTMLIEHKWTGKQQIVIKAHVLHKIYVEAWTEGRTPVLGFSLDNKNYVVLSEDDFLEIQDLIARLRRDEGLGEEG